MAYPEDYRPEGQSTMQSTMEQAKEKTQDVAEQAKEKVSEATGSARGYLREQANQRTTQAGDYVGKMSRDLRKAGDTLKQENSPAAGVVTMAADRMDSVAGYMHRSNWDSMVRDLENVARRNPWAFAAGGLVLGFLLSRFIRTAAGPMEEQHRQQEIRPYQEFRPEYGPGYPQYADSSTRTVDTETNIYGPSMERERTR